MSVLTEILLFVYGSGFLGGLLCGLPAGFLAAVMWELVRNKKRRAEAARFAKELDQWVEEIDEEKAEKKTQRVLGDDS